MSMLSILKGIDEELDIIQEQEFFQSDVERMNDIGEAIGCVNNCIDAIESNLLNRLINKREKCNLTARKVGEYLGVDDPGNFCNTELFNRQEHGITTDQLEKLGNLYGCGVKYLTGESDESVLDTPIFRDTDSVEKLHSVASMQKIMINLIELKSLL